MADDKDKLNQHDETNEYQFHDDEVPYNYEYDETTPKSSSTDPVSDAGEAPQSSSGKKPLRKLIVVVVILVIVFVVFEVVHRMKEKEATTQRTPAPSSKAVKTNPTMVQAHSVSMSPKPFPEKKPAANAATQMQNPNDAALAEQKKENTDLKQQLEALKSSSTQQIDSLKAAQDASQTQVSDLKGRVSDLNAQLDAVNQSLQSVSGKLSDMQARAAKERAWRAQAKARHDAAVRHDKRYFVEAVIPGRAWLKAKDGSTVTVAVGDVLPGYGKIVSINPYSGVVMTSQGRLPYGITG
ncbi:MAG: hypothetical protein COV52_08560 [Gammaproteobacteria bacterium CG11_big_fil_rev_8_21_14_0_20_46_22]|nr:MAG: hypothetical protein COW05_01030 [Gammaproteobacteria bacterium CG12_big_fil_rev_8_21_14_0_65_46_12]PIR10544.1 MAG: hypothetical protein COV52_08560 [Gammaproteobacteria bacterium CG11_big_fil_rev_8_21_14_0_20_46_22]